jgi:cob(I)alamin adenosyltransferase
MVRIDKIYTRGGDGGMTSLGDGTRVSKSCSRIASYGEVDELNAVLGMCLDQISDPSERTLLMDIQHELFDLGADLCTPPSATSGERQLRIGDAAVKRLEGAIDTANENLPPLLSFILPGGTPLASVYHLGRTVCRRAERSMQQLAEDEGGDAVNPSALEYVNRLSDLLFVLARRAAGRDEVLWEPGRAAST